MYEKNVASFDEMTNFSKDLRRHLDGHFVISPLALEERLVSAKDGTEKFLFRTHDGLYVESGPPQKRRHRRREGDGLCFEPGRLRHGLRILPDRDDRF